MVIFSILVFILQSWLLPKLSKDCLQELQLLSRWYNCCENKLMESVKVVAVLQVQVIYFETVRYIVLKKKLALKWPFIGQPDSSMSFAWNNAIIMEINPWKFCQKQFTIHQIIIKNANSKIHSSKINIFCMIPMKVRLKWWGGMDGTQLTWLPQFLEKKALCGKIWNTFSVGTHFSRKFLKNNDL